MKTNKIKVSLSLNKEKISDFDISNWIENEEVILAISMPGPSPGALTNAKGRTKTGGTVFGPLSTNC